MDGRKSFVFSWDKKHRVIHEEALLHYFDPSKKGQKFEYQPSRAPSSQTLQSASLTELEKEAVQEDPTHQLSSRVFRIEIGKEVSGRGGARPKKFNMSRSPKGKMHHIFPLALFEGTLAIHNSHFTTSIELPQSLSLPASVFSFNFLH